MNQVLKLLTFSLALSGNLPALARARETEVCKGAAIQSAASGQIPKLKEQTEAALATLCSVPDFPEPATSPLSASKLAEQIFQEQGHGAPLRLTRHLLKPKQLNPNQLLPLNLKPVHSTTLNSQPVLVSQLMRGWDRDFAIAYVLGPNKKWIPRFLYRSLSDGSWRSAPEVLVGDNPDDIVYSKGRELHYTQETKVVPEIAQFLEALPVNRILSREERLRIEHAFSEASPVNQKAKREWVERIYSYPKSIELFEDRGLLSRFQMCPPGSCFTKKPVKGSHLDKILELNASLSTPAMKLFIPNFSKAPEREYFTSHSLLSANGRDQSKVSDIHVRVFEGILQGKTVEWHMAQDPTGRTWVDRIRLKECRSSDYLTDALVINTGILTNKPLEHRHQALGLETGREALDFDYSYVDITPLLGNLAPIRDFKKHYPTPSKNPEFLRARADVSPGHSPLHFIAEQGTRAEAELALKKTADVNVPTSVGWTPLMSAAWNGNLEVMEALARAGANLEAQSHEGFTALHLAARNSQFAAVAVLLKLKASPAAAPALSKPSLWQAVNGIEKSALLQELVRLNSNFQPPVDLSLRDLDGLTPLARAISRGDLPLIDLLLEQGAKLEWNETGTKRSWLPLAAGFTEPKILDHLLAKRPGPKAILQVTPTGDSIGHIAASENRSELIDALKKRGANLNAVNLEGESPLILALALAHSAVAQALLDAGVDVNQPQQDGNTPLHYACSAGNLGLIKSLLRKGAVIKQNHQGLTPLSYLATDMDPAEFQEASRLLKAV